jgi:hypothetical protein
MSDVIARAAGRRHWAGDDRQRSRGASAEAEALAIDLDGEAARALRAAAWALWEERYEELSADRPGLLGAILGRAKAQVVRLALVYALLAWQATCSRTASGHPLAMVTGNDGAGPAGTGTGAEQEQMNSRRSQCVPRTRPDVTRW